MLVASERLALSLQIAERSCSLWSIGPQWVYFAEATDLPSGEGTLVVSIDGRERRHRARLPHGASAASRRATLEWLSPTSSPAATVTPADFPEEFPVAIP